MFEHRVEFAKRLRLGRTDILEVEVSFAELGDVGTQELVFPDIITVAMVVRIEPVIELPPDSPRNADSGIFVRIFERSVVAERFAALGVEIVADNTIRSSRRLVT